jgi:RNA polymerase sporulation-specific sigma factor
VTDAERDSAILGLKPTVEKLAKWMYHKTFRYAILDDLIQAGWIGAIQAVDRYNASRVTTLLQYAHWRIKGAIVDHLRANGYWGQQQRAGAKDAPQPEHIFENEIEWRYKDPVPQRQFELIEASKDASDILGRVHLSARYRKVLLDSYNDRTFKDIAKDIGVHESYVSYIRSRALEKIRESERKAGQRAVLRTINLRTIKNVDEL